MANELEKRISDRFCLEGPITLQNTIMTSKELNANLLNYSEQGICFATGTKLAPGTTVLFKTRNDSDLFTDLHADCQLRSMSMVTVKWCHERLHQNPPDYLIGAAYMAPL